MIRGMDYFYDAQIYRFLEQIVRAYSGFKYMTGSRAGLPPVEQVVPVRMAPTDRLVASIMKNLSDNTLFAAPLIAVYITGVSGRRDDLQNPAHVDTRQVVERAIDPVSGEYEHGRGKSYTVKRLMALPMTMTVNVDVWTTNLNQKLQLLEQITIATYPDFDIQNSNNALDWTALTRVQVRDDITFTSRAIPIGTADEIDIMTFTLDIPFWLSPPAIITQQMLIEQIVTDVSEEKPTPGIVTDSGHYGDPMWQQVTTPGNYRVNVSGNEITLINDAGEPFDDQGYPNSWERLINQYGVLRPAESKLILKNEIEEPLGIVGTLQPDPTRPNVLFWQIDPDTLPVNTLQPIDGVVDPHKSFPGGGLPQPVPGQRYLIVSDIGTSQVWGVLNAKYGDIIEYSTLGWNVAFNAALNTSSTQYVLNLAKGAQMKWTGEDWTMAIDGEYPPGLWRLNL
jgi:hypothetical protein